MYTLTLSNPLVLCNSSALCPPRPVRHADEWFPRAKQPNCVIKCVPTRIILSTIEKEYCQPKKNIAAEKR